MPILQMHLFSNAFPLQEEAFSCLRNFAFEQAIDLLHQARELHPDLPNNALMEEVARMCLENHLGPEATPGEIVELWEQQHQEQAFAGAATPLQKLLFETLASRLLVLDPFDATGALLQAPHFFHRSACLIHTGDFAGARKLLVDLLAQEVPGMPARYWGYYGDAARQAHKAREANLGYLRLLAMNPFDVDWCRFQHAELRVLFADLREKHDLQKAYGLWPYYAWTENLLEIPAGNQYIDKILAANFAKLDPDLSLTPFERTHRFSLCVFDDLTQREAAPSVDLRKKMKALDAALLQEYLSRRAAMHLSC